MLRLEFCKAPCNGLLFSQLQRGKLYKIVKSEASQYINKVALLHVNSTSECKMIILGYEGSAATCSIDQDRMRFEEIESVTICSY